MSGGAGGQSGSNGAGYSGGSCNNAVGGGGATQSAGGSVPGGGSSGSLHTGGAGNNAGGGGGGYYGGGGGFSGAGGGGGSSWVKSPAGSAVSYTGASREGHGMLEITYDAIDPTAVPTIAPTISFMPTISLTPTSKPSKSPSSQPSRQPSSQPSRQPVCRPSSQPSRQPTSQPSRQPAGRPSCQPSRQPSAQPSVQPIMTPSAQPSVQPQSLPSSQPTGNPSIAPTVQPSRRPSVGPSSQPTNLPSLQPYAEPSTQPNGIPSCQPTAPPSSQPSCSPTFQPSRLPSVHPTSQPSSQPSVQPFAMPSSHPTDHPSVQPTGQPNAQPSSNPTYQPSCLPSNQPTGFPSCQPSGMPTAQPTRRPSVQPSVTPTKLPSCQPSITPTIQPSVTPSSQPSEQPTGLPSFQPTLQPSSQPSTQPAAQPSRTPTVQPQALPTRQPSNRPTSRPSCGPSTQPSVTPSNAPSVQPTAIPSDQPSVQPFTFPTNQPSSRPSAQPTFLPTQQPSSEPSQQPFVSPTSLPSSSPSLIPSTQPSCQPSAVPTIITDRPSPKPSTVSLGTLPGYASLSVHSAGNSSFHLVLPFLFTSSYSGDAYVDVVVKGAENGTCFVMFGAREVISYYSVVNTGSSDGLVMTPAMSYDFSGRSVSSAGDINGDGIDDLIIGVPYAAKVYVLFDKPAIGFVNLTEGFTVFGASSSDLTGWSVSSAGDVNNDTFADIVIGAPYAGVWYAGAAYVLFGKPTGFHDIYCLALNLSDGFEIRGAVSQDNFGLSVSGAGDVYGDGYGDIVVGSLKQSAFYSGATTVLSRGINGQITIGSTVTGPSWSWFGYSVTGTGDVNGDCLGDILVGSVPRRTTGGVPLSYLLFGHNGSTATSQEVVTVDAVDAKVVIIGGGIAVYDIGDINDDGLADVMVLGSDVSLLTGGGFVVYQPVAMARSWHPSNAPTMFPTSAPTSPTVAPTIVPTTPTAEPTTEPSQPSSQPTSRPTAPTIKPTCDPTLKPSLSPTIAPTVNPTKSPTKSPTKCPSTVTPTLKSKLPITRTPSKYPLARPTITPTVFTIFNSSYKVVLVEMSKIVERNVVNKTNYIVNTTGAVRFVNSAAGDMFTILPISNATTTIEQFTTTSDVLDLRAFTKIHRIEQLNFTEQVDKQRRHLRSSISTSVRVHFPQNQLLILVNTSSSEFQTSRIFFFRRVKTPVNSSETLNKDKKMDELSWALIGVLSVAACLLVILLFKSVKIQVEECRQKSLMLEPINWDEEMMWGERRTFLTFIHDGWDPSTSSSSNNNSNHHFSIKGSDDSDSDSSAPSVDDSYLSLSPPASPPATTNTPTNRRGSVVVHYLESRHRLVPTKKPPPSDSESEISEDSSLNRTDGGVPNLLSRPCSEGPAADEDDDESSGGGGYPSDFTISSQE